MDRVNCFTLEIYSNRLSIGYLVLLVTVCVCVCVCERERERERERESCDQSVVITLQIDVLYCNSTQYTKMIIFIVWTCTKLMID